MRINIKHFIYNQCVVLLAFSICNLLFMHYYILNTCYMEMPLDITSYFDNLCAVLFETLFLLLCFYIIFLKKIRIALCATFCVTFIWSFCNILYSRFFMRYITLSTIGQTGNLFDRTMIECMIDGLRMTDLYYIIIPITYYFVNRIIGHKGKYNFSLKILLLLFPAVIIFNLFIHALYCCSNSKLLYLTYYKERLFNNHFIIDYNLGRPNWANFHRGSIRTLIAETIIANQTSIELNSKQIKTIQNVFITIPDSTLVPTNPNTKNIIFVLVESYLSLATNCTIDGKKIMPFLDSLSRQPDVYYNSNMRPNITLGQSSDGQFIYMTGMLPLRSILTISKAKNVSLPGLPFLLTKQYPDMKSRMIIPTMPSLWEQQTMCNAYGFHDLFSCKDYNGQDESILSDKEMFNLAGQKDQSTNQPFFSILLTMAMHSPYNKEHDSSFHIDKYDEQMNNYLNACHYTDKQIKKYFEKLKRIGLYNNSLIVIASDHQALEKFVDVEQYGYNRHLPFFLINANLAPGQAWRGECNQIDVYPTLLDLLGIKSRWRGQGKSLLSNSYDNVITEQDWQISEWILFGDYFHLFSSY